MKTQMNGKNEISASKVSAKYIGCKAANKGSIFVLAENFALVAKLCRDKFFILLAAYTLPEAEQVSL